MSNPYIDEYGANTHFQTGVSGNPAGRPKGSKNKRTIVRELLESPDFDWSMLGITNISQGESPTEAITYTMILKAVNGDVRAAKWLRVTAYGE